uniref:DNA mismatch repair protein MSH2 n=1 Tax=Dunaliella tertiolecta TaxID=3047 RepID=A0A7S3QKU8_DUNTE|mmetsp:Transcript_13810/g.37311  ORF Transcript_13810/g.37311 Transcript_13810/m.37311 type:complete len:957 (+) Transcript_13810:1337-4207(+)|eukprot:CAMPEP_0202340418 /NCGR_PEP_ID=MMETSP1126-20121109/1867_1 /ASSEMBLY_ACC=CAM_ASM_000457 /TAXON_ID=3047 /ORGANISM="Dunaliella tertiolecta, Strain CCMP1320" /LENGTH=956 /DNA_ID=CAMNT_0048931123 /DNA_START=1295 /DNA_END=4165 /DNA_ORIENTATION=+
MAESEKAPDLQLDEKSQQGFINWYRGLPQEGQKIRVFDRKTFYTVHGEDALFVARRFCNTTAVVKYLGKGEGSLASVSLNRHLLENMLRVLLVEEANHVVEMWEGSGASWKMTKSASPGRLAAFEEELFKGVGASTAATIDVNDAPVVIAVWQGMVEGRPVVGAAYVDAASHQLGVSQLDDDEQLCALEAIIVQLGAKEAVVCKEDRVDGGAVGPTLVRRCDDVLERCGVMASARPRSMFATKHLAADLEKLVKGHSVERHQDVMERKAGCSALAAVLAFTETLADSGGHGKWSLSLYDAQRFMRLDAAAQRALNVFPSRLDTSATFSLYGLMARGRTAMGKRRLRAWLKQPLVDPAEITSRLNVVEALVSDAELREKLRDQHMRGLPDVERLVRKLDSRRAGNAIGLGELCQLYRVSARLPLIEDALRQHEGPHAQMLQERYCNELAVAHDQDHLCKFEELVEAAVDLDRVPDEYLIAPAYREDLQRLHDEKEKLEREVEQCAVAAAKDLDLVLDKTIKLEWHKAQNMRTRCLRITQKEEKRVRSKLSNGVKYRTIEARKDGIKFTSKQLERAATLLQDNSAKYEELQKELVEQVVDVARSFVEVWEGLTSLLSELDVLAGFADLAANAPDPYARPEVVDADAGELSLLGSRHPCVEAQDGVDFIKNDCVMRRGESWFQIITGPNMGGKSTFIRQVGACVLMAQVGCFVPCTSARICVRDAIFARVGAGDCQQRGVSTFMAEMLETGAILKGTTKNSLVIIDELGRGTSTYDGFGLAWAISEHLMETTQAPTLFATHFHELTEITGPTGVRNLHVSTVVDPTSGRLTMLYQIKEGACDQSFGIQVAESAGFPASVVQLAREKLAQLEGAEIISVKAAGTKRKREQEGDQGDEAQAARKARCFLQEFASLPLPDGEGPEEAKAEAVAHASALLKKLEADAQGNPCLAALIAQASAC